MSWTSTPTSRSRQFPSAVKTGTASCWPRARQARSPKERPALRVVRRKIPALYARSSPKGWMSSSTSRKADRIAGSGTPLSTSLDTTSERLTALIAAPGMLPATISLPGSAFSRARSAEASNTTLLKLRIPAAIRDELVRKAWAFGDVGPDDGLSPSDTLLRSHYADRFVLEDQDQLVARFHPKLSPIFRRDNEPATFSQFCHDSAHMAPPFLVFYKIFCLALACLIALTRPGLLEACVVEDLRASIPNGVYQHL